jgi:eukaryotic-like serine/threonine-protein kinase
MSQHELAGEPPPQAESQPVTVGRYLLHRQIARGGMATIHIARLIGDEGFNRIVAAKRLLPEFAEDSEFVAMFLDEGRVASRIHHRNVVPVLDVVTTGGEVILVQEYVHGAPLHWLLKAARRNKCRIPIDIAVSIACQVLAGLHAAHETLDEMGMPLHIVHRDVSPQNVMVAVDGTARLLDFGIAKAAMAAHITREGQFKGKLAYAAPEQLYGHATLQSDVYSLSVLLWELLVGYRMHQSMQGEVELVATIMNGRLPTITAALAADRDSLGPDRWRELQALEPVIKVGLAVEVADRWTTAADMEQALVDVVRPASSADVAGWIKTLGKEFIENHDRVLATEEASWRRVATTLQLRIASVPREIPRELSGPGSSSGARSTASVPSTPGLVPAQPVAPVRPWQPGLSTLIAALCGLIVALVIVIVVVIRSPSTRTVVTPPLSAAPAPSATTPASAAVAPTSAAVAPASTSPATAPTATPAVPGAGAVAMPPRETPETAPIAAAPTAPSTGTQALAAPTTGTPTTGTPTTGPSSATPTTANPSATVTAEPTIPPEPIELRIGRGPSSPPRRPTPPPAPRKPAVATPPAPTPAPATTRTSPDPKADCEPPFYFENQKKIFKPQCL